MTRRTKIWLIAVLAFVLYVAAALIASWMFKLRTRDIWVLTVGLIALGFSTAAFILWYYRDITVLAPPTPDDELAADVDRVVGAARSHLATAKTDGATRKGARFGSLPVVVVVGPAGSTKTTAVVHSGLEPELLAGEAVRGETVAPTHSVNLWYGQGTVFAEAGHSVVASQESWHRLVRALRPRSFLAALTGRPQPARHAVVCFPCDELVKPGSGEAVPAAARALRERLGEAARALGVQLPTYVLFTKADALPHFEEYVRNFSADESREPLGASISADSGGAGTYAERATAKLERAAHELYRSLGARRLAVLAREHAAEWKPGAYEFPREIRKLTPLMVEFLREIGRPSALQASPVLRGFYFTGVQAVYINEVTPDYAPAQRARAADPTRSATQVFSPEMVAGGAAAVPNAPRTRKVPRWDFLPRFFREVVLGDEAAVRLTRGGQRVGFVRRASLAAVSTFALVYAVALVVSYRGNRRLEDQAADATRGIAAISPNNADLPPVDALRRLDALRTQLDTLSAYEHDGPPLSLRWGLYSGAALYPAARRAYFGGFSRLMFATTRAVMLDALRRVPDAPRPSDDYGESYALLKGYLITTAHPEKSTPEFLSPVMMKYWLVGRPLDPERAQLAQRQFDTYAHELQFGNPLPEQTDPNAVARGRAFLRGFAGSERIYQFMLAEAAKTNQPVQFNRKFPGVSQYVFDSYEVPGAFTRGGFNFMQGAFKTVDRFLQGEGWVVGENQQTVDNAKLVADLRTRYLNEYADHWRRYLRAASVARYAGVGDASQKLVVLSGNQSPLLELFSLAARNTNVAAPEIANVFQPVQTVTPGADTLKLIGQANQPYMAALVSLQSSLEQAARTTGSGTEAAAGQAAGNAASAKSAARTIAASFTIDQQGQVHSTVQKLLEEPITNAELLISRFGADQVNARTRSFCAQIRPLLTKLPFNPSSSMQASIAEVAAVLRPGTGSLWTMYNDVLQGALQKQGTQYSPSGGNVRLSPAFIAFFNRAAAFSDALFAGGSPDPHLSITVQPQLTEGTTAVTVTLEGDAVRASRNSLQTSRVDWPAANHEAKLAATLADGTEMTLVGPYAGPWAMFQLFNDADSWLPVGAASRAEWTLRTRTQGISLAGGRALKVSVDVTPASATAVLRRGFFSGTDCAGDAAR